MNDTSLIYAHAASSVLLATPLNIVLLILLEVFIGTSGVKKLQPLQGMCPHAMCSFRLCACMPGASACIPILSYCTGERLPIVSMPGPEIHHKTAEVSGFTIQWVGWCHQTVFENMGVCQTFHG